MITIRSRFVFNNQAVICQADFFQGDLFTRLTGLTPTGLSSQVFFNNLLQPWPLLTGNNITDAQIASGTLYFNEIAGSPGVYSLRFRPNAVGYWRINLSYVAGTQTILHDFDVIGEVPSAEAQRLRFSFERPDSQ